MNTKTHKQKTRARRTRAKLAGTRPRLSVFVSNKHIYAQVLDPKKGTVLASASDKDTKDLGKNIEIATKVGEVLGKKAKEKGVDKVVFDRGGRKYHGRIKALADGARKELTF